MKRLAIIASLFLMLIGFAGTVTAQGLSEPPDMKGRWVYGGNIGGGMSGNYLNLSLAPQVGYRIISPWELGVRGVYDLSCEFIRGGSNYYEHYFGLAPYTNFEVYKSIFLHVEDEVMYGFGRYDHQTTESRWFNTVFFGGGYRQYTYGGSHIYLMVLYNLSWGLLQNEGNWDTPYKNTPIEIRVGFCF